MANLMAVYFNIYQNNPNSHKQITAYLHPHPEGEDRRPIILKPSAGSKGVLGDVGPEHFYVVDMDTLQVTGETETKRFGTVDIIGYFSKMQDIVMHCNTTDHRTGLEKRSWHGQIEVALTTGELLNVGIFFDRYDQHQPEITDSTASKYFRVSVTKVIQARNGYPVAFCELEGCYQSRTEVLRMNRLAHQEKMKLVRQPKKSMN